MTTGQLVNTDVCERYEITTNLWALTARTAQRQILAVHSGNDSWNSWDFQLQHFQVHNWKWRQHYWHYSTEADSTYKLHVARREIIDIGRRLWRRRRRWRHSTMHHFPPPTCTAQHTPRDQQTHTQTTHIETNRQTQRHADCWFAAVTKLFIIL